MNGLALDISNLPRDQVVDLFTQVGLTLEWADSADFLEQTSRQDAELGLVVIPIDESVDIPELIRLLAAVANSPANCEFAYVFADTGAAIHAYSQDLQEEHAVNFDHVHRMAEAKRVVSRAMDRQKERATRLFLDSTSDGYWVYYIDTGVVEWSDRTFHLLGRDPGEGPLDWESYSDILHPDDRELVAEAVREHLEHGVEYRNVPMRMRTAFGGYRDMYANGQAVRDGKGRPIMMVGAVADRTAQNRTEQALKESQERYGILFQAMNDAALLADPLTGLIIDANEPAERLWGRSRDDLIGSPQASLHPEHLTESARDAFRTHIRQLQANNRSVLHMPILRSDGTEVPVEISSSLFDMGDRRYLLGLFRDISDRIEAEKALRQRDAQLQFASRLAAMGRLAAGVGHEINNPLSYISGNLTFIADELATMDDVDPEVVGALEDAITGASRVRDIVADLKAFTRQDDGDDASCDVDEVIAGSVRMARSELRHVAQIETACEPDLRAAISDSQLSQVLLNVLTNAGQAMDDADLRKNHIGIAATVRSPGWIRISITDNGRGMTAEEQDLAFGAFFTTRQRSGGTGLGLSICHRIIEQAGGEITLSSRVGIGTTVTLDIPAEDPAKHAAPENPAELTAGQSSARKRVLVIDDDPIVAKVLSRLLSASHDVDILHDATGAFETPDLLPSYDVILCDLMMPTMSGEAFYQRLLDEHPRLAVRVAFVTGGAVTDSVAQFEDGMSKLGRVLLKPVGREQLLEAVARIEAAEALGA